MVKVKKAIEDIRRLSGYSLSGSKVNSTNILVNDNLIISSINDTIRSMSINQYRPFLNTLSLNYDDMLGNDLYKISDVFGWSSSLSDSTTPVGDLLQVSQDKQVSRVNFWYDSNSGNGTNNFIFNSNNFVYNPNEYEKYIGSMYRSRTIVLKPLERVLFKSNDINTYKLEFIIKLEGHIVDRFMPVFNDNVSVIYFSKAGISIHLDYEQNMVQMMHQRNGGLNVFSIDFNSYTGSSTSCYLMYDGKIRELGAKDRSCNTKQVQAYIIPYFVVDINQEIPKEVSGELYELFIFEAAIHLQEDLRSIDSDLLKILEEKRSEYRKRLTLEKISKQSFYPSLS